jgi:ubiquinone/menaquinone biosynthesis C-methylase UbiE
VITVRPAATARDGVHHAYTKLARRYDERWARYLEATVTETLKRTRVGRGEAVLDVGCGTGILLDRMQRAAPSLRLTCIDLVPAVVRQATRRLAVRAGLAAADAARLPFAAASFDLVLSTSSLHYWPDPVAGLREMARVLRPTGHVVITDWCDDYLGCWIWDRLLRLADPAHRRAYGREECRRLLAQAGLRIESVDRYKIDWLWGLMTARAWAGQRCAMPAPAADGAATGPSPAAPSWWARTMKRRGAAPT